MKYEDYEKKLTELVKNPDSAALAVQDILKDLKADSETFASLEAMFRYRPCAWCTTYLSLAIGRWL